VFVNLIFLQVRIAHQVTQLVSSLGFSDFVIYLCPIWLQQTAFQIFAKIYHIRQSENYQRKGINLHSS